MSLVSAPQSNSESVKEAGQTEVSETRGTDAVLLTFTVDKEFAQRHNQSES